MKILQRLFIASLLFYLLNCDCLSFTEDNYYNDKGEFDYDFTDFGVDSTASLQNCNSRQFSEYEKSSGIDYKCCFVKGKCTYPDEDDNEKKVSNFQYCVPLSKSSYSNLGKQKDQLKGEFISCDELSIDCSGSSLSYLYLAFILLILF